MGPYLVRGEEVPYRLLQTVLNARHVEVFVQPCGVCTYVAADITQDDPLRYGIVLTDWLVTVHGMEERHFQLRGPLHHLLFHVAASRWLITNSWPHPLYFQHGFPEGEGGCAGTEGPGAAQETRLRLPGLWQASAGEDH